MTRPAVSLTAGAARARLLAALPFALTGAQTRALGEVDADLRAGGPMVRLLQGDVGCGKTVVAAARGRARRGQRLCRRR